ncbi:hypothetical protein LINGRAHAP2_LOCUS9903 [Linum grandiflorum]
MTRINREMHKSRNDPNFFILN